MERLAVCQDQCECEYGGEGKSGGLPTGIH